MYCSITKNETNDDISKTVYKLMNYYYNNTRLAASHRRNAIFIHLILLFTPYIIMYLHIFECEMFIFIIIYNSDIILINICTD